MLFSCGKPDDVTSDNKESTSIISGEEDPLTLLPCSEIWKVYAVSKNVYSGRILNKESKEDEKGRVDYYLTISVDAVYKGEYNVGDVVSEVYSKDMSYRMSFYLDIRYFIMSGIDENVTDSDRAKSIIKYSPCSAIRLGSNGVYTASDYSGYLYSMRNYSFDDILYNFMFSYEQQMLDCLGKDYFSEKTAKEYCDLADNVYYGEVLQSTQIGVYKPTGKPIYQNKIRVMNVYKGEYKPGEIVEDVSLKNYGIAPDLEEGFPIDWGRMSKNEDCYKSKYAFFISGEYYDNLFFAQ